MEHTPFSSIVSGLPALTPFVAPEALERRAGRAFALRLGANESPFGPSAKAVEAMSRAATQVQNYGDPESHDLRSALAAKLNLGTENLVVGPGIDGLLSHLARTILDPGQVAVTTHGSYPTFDYAVLGAGGILQRVPYRNDTPHLEGLLDAAERSRSRIVYIANPDNPSGSWHSPEALLDLKRRLPAGCLLVIDEAYLEFAPETTDGFFHPEDESVVRLRTFSKAHGMAGARIAYAISHPSISDALNKIRMHFEVNSVAQAGALASLQNPEHIASVVAETTRGRKEMARHAESLGLRPLASSTNFLTIDVGGPERARAILSALLDTDVFIRMPGSPPLDRCIRVTIGNQQHRIQFAEALATAINSTRD